MCFTRRYYHSLTKKLESDGNSATRRILGQSMLSKYSKTLRSEVSKKINSTKSLPSTQVDTFSNDLDISNCFANNYKSLFSSVLSSKSSLSEIDRSINSAVTDLIFDRESG